MFKSVYGTPEKCWQDKVIRKIPDYTQKLLGSLERMIVQSVPVKGNSKWAVPLQVQRGTIWIGDQQLKLYMIFLSMLIPVYMKILLP